MFPAAVRIEKLKNLSTFRKIALGSWHSVGDPSTYLLAHMDASHILERKKKILEDRKNPGNTDQRSLPSITALVGMACGKTFAAYPKLNGFIRFGTIYLRKDVDLFFQAAADTEGHELSGVRVEKAQTKNVYEVMAELQSKAKLVRSDQDPEFKKVKAQFKWIPGFFIKYILNFLSFVIYTLNLDLRIFGLPKDPFGSMMITSVGNMGFEMAFAPLIPYSRVPLLVTVCSTQEKAVVRHGKIEIVPYFALGFTADHRLVDGMYGSKMLKKVKHFLETEEGLKELGF